MYISIYNVFFLKDDKNNKNKLSNKKKKVKCVTILTLYFKTIGSSMEDDARMYEYTSAANPNMPAIPVLVHAPELHQSGPTRIIPFDLRQHLECDYAATSPNLMASFLRINANETLDTHAVATSQAFYVIRGSGTSTSQYDDIHWSEGDLFVLPSQVQVAHTANTDTAIYWVTDEPLMNYLGVAPNVSKFKPTLFRKEKMLAEVEHIKHEPGAEHRNRLGIYYLYFFLSIFHTYVQVFYLETKSLRLIPRRSLMSCGLFLTNFHHMMLNVLIVIILLLLTYVSLPQMQGYTH